MKGRPGTVRFSCGQTRLARRRLFDLPPSILGLKQSCPAIGPTTSRSYGEVLHTTSCFFSFSLFSFLFLLLAADNCAILLVRSHVGYRQCRNVPQITTPLRPAREDKRETALPLRLLRSLRCFRCRGKYQMYEVQPQRDRNQLLSKFNVQL